MSDLEKLRENFMVEATELLNDVESLALELETNGGNEESIRTLFRNVHTLKGAAGMFGFPQAESFLHHFEFLLDSFRSGKLIFQPEYSSLILESADLVRRIVFEGNAPADLEKKLQAKITALVPVEDDFGDVPPLPVVAQKTFPAAAPVPKTVSAENRFTIQAHMAESCGSADIKLFVDGLKTAGSVRLFKNALPVENIPSFDAGDELLLLMETPLSEADLQGILEFAGIPAAFHLQNGFNHPDPPDRQTAGTAHVAVAADDEIEETELDEDVDMSVHHEEVLEDAPPVEKNVVAETKHEEKAAANAESNVETTMRIQIEILEKLMNLVSELVLNRNQLLQLTQKDENSQFTIPVQQLNRLISSLQEAVMQTRMQPVGNAWTKLPRMVRDLSVELGKKIELVQTGAKTELDRHIIQVIQEPLLHLVRNAVDHGVEMPAIRKAAGKPETGTLKLNAYHEAGQIVIEITDDGGGVDPANIRKKLVEKGWMKSDEASKLSRQQLFDYLFEPGFSTKEVVTKLSGRGVGLDAVKKSLEKVGGNIDMQSTIGKGTSFKIKIPLTLAIISALIVRDNEQVFAIPQISIQELVLVNGGNIDKIDKIHEALVYHLRDELLPLISLSELLGGTRSDDFIGSYIVVLQLADLRFGLIVDEVMNIQEIVVKPISRFAKSLNLYSGSTIIGGSDIILILDTNGISQKAKLLSESMQLGKRNEQNKADAEGEKTTLLLVGMGETIKAIPLDLVDRLEEFNPSKVEFVDKRPVIQYRGRVLALHNVPDPLPTDEDVALRTVVFKNGNRVAGLVVNNFEDVVDEVLDMDTVDGSPGVLGWSVVSGRSMEIVDVGFYMDLKIEAQADSRGPAKSVMIIEESSFVRNHIKFLLKSAKYKVVTASDAPEALKVMRETSTQIDALVIGTELKSMNVKSFVNLLRESGLAKNRPLLAVSTMSRIPDQLASLFDVCIEGLGKKDLLDAVEMSFQLVNEKN